MRRVVISLLICMAGFQSFAAKGSGIFINAGLSMSKMNGDSLENFMSDMIFDRYMHDPTNNKAIEKLRRETFRSESGPRMAPSFKIGYEQSFNRVLSLSAGVGLVFGGNTTNIEDFTETEFETDGTSKVLSDADISTVIEYTHLIIPINLKIMAPIKRGGFYLKGGPQFGFLLKADYVHKYDNSVTNKHIEEKRDLKKEKELEGFNMAMGFRVGGEIPIGGHHLYLESGYDWGLSDISKQDGIEAKTGSLTLLSIGFRITLAFAFFVLSFLLFLLRRLLSRFSFYFIF